MVLAAMLGLGAAVGLYEGILFYFGNAAGPRLQAAWSLVAILLLGMWMEADSRGRSNIYRPFEFGWFVILFAVPYLPYYLVKTRGALGIVWLVAFIFILWLGYWLQWLIYIAS